jgi:hypothetical protein
MLVSTSAAQPRFQAWPLSGNLPFVSPAITPHRAFYPALGLCEIDSGRVLMRAVAAYFPQATELRMFEQ